MNPLRLFVALAVLTSVSVASIMVRADRFREIDEMEKLGVHVDVKHDASRRTTVHISIALDASEDGRIPDCFLVVYSKPIETEIKSGGRKWFSKRFMSDGAKIIRRELLIQRGVGADLYHEEIDCGVIEVLLPRTDRQMNFELEEFLLLKDVEIRANQSLEPTAMLVTPRADARAAPSTSVAHL